VQPGWSVTNPSSNLIAYYTFDDTATRFPENSIRPVCIPRNTTIKMTMDVRWAIRHLGRESPSGIALNEMERYRSAWIASGDFAYSSVVLLINEVVC